jgi:hypothetical protein
MKYNHRSYSTLLLPEIETLDLKTSKSLLKFSEHGGTIVFIRKKPFKSPSYKNGERIDAEVKKMVDEMLQKPNVILHSAPEDDIIQWYTDLQKKLEIKPYVSLNKTHKFLSQSSYKIADRNLFFIANASLSEHISVTAEFDVSDDLHPWIWNPESGEKYRYPISGNNNTLRLEIPKATSVIIIFEPETNGDEFVVAKRTKDGTEIKGPWQLKLNHINGKSQQFELDGLTNLIDINTTKEFAGEVIYEKSVNINSDEIKIIDLGEVHGVTELSVNGKLIGTKWYGEQVYDISEVVKNGENKLSIKLTTIAGNYLKSLKDNPVAMRWVSRQEYYPMGIIGPVKLF